MHIIQRHHCKYQGCSCRTARDQLSKRHKLCRTYTAVHIDTDVCSPNEVLCGSVMDQCSFVMSLIKYAVEISRKRQEYIYRRVPSERPPLFSR